MPCRTRPTLPHSNTSLSAPRHMEFAWGMESEGVGCGRSITRYMSGTIWWNESPTYGNYPRLSAWERPAARRAAAQRCAESREKYRQNVSLHKGRRANHATDHAPTHESAWNSGRDNAAADGSSNSLNICRQPALQKGRGAGVHIFRLDEHSGHLYRRPRWARQ